MLPAMKRIGFLLLLSGILFVVARPSAMIPDQVRIETGALAGVVGTTQPTVRVFKGIPFAAPPLGENRWRAPQPAAKWDGVRNADAFGAPCTAGAPLDGRGGGGEIAAARGGAAAGAQPPATPRLHASRHAAKTVSTSTSGPARRAPTTAVR